VKKHAEKFKSLGLDCSFFGIKTPFGHLGGVLNITQAADAITQFLEK
jgi:hypothetical protein